MAIYKSDIVDINLESGSIHRSFMKHSIGTADQAADRFGIRAFRNGEAVDLSGASCYGYFRDPQGNNIALTSNGTVDGNVAYVTLPQACYNYEGNFTLTIKLLVTGVTSTVRIIDGVVDNTNTGSAVAPTSAVPTYSEILSQYDDMVAATAVANGAIATTFNAATVYPAGSYVINDGALYRITADHAANVTWANTSKVATNFGAEVSSLKSAFRRYGASENLMGQEGNVYYPVDIKAGEVFTISTSDGSTYPSSESFKLYLYDSTKTRIDDFGLAADKRVITAPSNKNDVKYLRFNKNPVVPLMVAMGNQVVAYQPYYPNVLRIQQELDEYETNTDGLIDDLAYLNMIDPAACEDGYEINKSGTKSSSSGRFVTDYIAVSEGMRIYWNSEYVRYITAYNSSKVVDSNKGYDVTSGVIVAYIVPSGISYIRISVIKTYVPGASIANFKVSTYPMGLNDIIVKRENIEYFDSVCPEMFGAIGDGTTDDTAAIQAAVDFAGQNKKELFLQQKTYKVSDIIDASYNGMTIRGNNASIKMINPSNETGNKVEGQKYSPYGILSFIGSASNLHSITAVYRGGYGAKGFRLMVTIDGTANINTGDYVEICIGNQGNNSGLAYRAGAHIICRVESRGSDTHNLYLDYDTPFDLAYCDLTDAFLQKVTPVTDIRISDLTLIDNSGYSNPDITQTGDNLQYTANGLGFMYCANVQITNLCGIGTQLPLIEITFGYNFTVNGLRFWKHSFLGPGEGYGCQCAGCFGVTITNVFTHSMRHAVDFSYSAFCAVRDVKTAIGKDNVNIDLHGIYEHDITIDSCNATVGIGNNPLYFPCVVANVRVVNSTIDVIRLDSYIDNIQFENCEIYFDGQTYANNITFNNCRLHFNMGSETATITPKIGISHQKNTLRISNCDITNEGGVNYRLIFDVFDYVYLIGSTIYGEFLLKPTGDMNFVMDGCTLRNVTLSPENLSTGKMNIRATNTGIIIDDGFGQAMSSINTVFNLANIVGKLRMILSDTIIDYSYASNFNLFSNPSSDTMVEFVCSVSSLIENNETENTITQNTTETGNRHFALSNVIA